MHYAHIIFDLDGTLVDSAADLSAAVNYVRETLGLARLPLEVVRGYVGEGVRRLIERALPADHQDRIEAAIALFRTYYAAHLLDRTRPYPGIVGMLEALSERGVALSVLSNKPSEMSRAILAGLGLLPRFIAVLGPELLPSRKPDPAGLVRLQALTNTPPERMLVVGDSGIDVRTARAAGFDFCGVAWGFKLDELLAAGLERIIAWPNELVEVLDSGIRSPRS